MINQLKNELKIEIQEVITQMAKDKNITMNDIKITIQKPPKSEMGDLSIPIFELSKILKTDPNFIMQVIKNKLKDRFDIKIIGTYLNIKLDRVQYIEKIIKKVQEKKENYGSSQLLKNKKITIEFSSPNTNKPLHIGHLRNDIIGESLSRILQFTGSNLTKVNIINDRGVHICKSMLAYAKFGNGETPKSTNKKSDHFVGDYYVKYNKYQKTHPEAETEIIDMLRKWENKDEEIIQLWQTMNQWALDGIYETYKLTNITFDKINMESEVFEFGRDIVLQSLEKGLCYKREDGAICIDIPQRENGDNVEVKQKVLLRSNGTAVYIIQDIGLAITRKKEFDFDELIYIVGSEQIYHFKTLFFLIEKLGYEWAKKLIHLPYGMVNLNDGKMKSREGIVVDADNLIQEMKINIIKDLKQRNNKLDNLEETALNISLAAIHYFLLKTSINKDITFDKKESLSLNGNSGPYLQYMGARINSILEKAEEHDINCDKEIDFQLLTKEDEWELSKIMAEFPKIIEDSAIKLNPTILTSYIYKFAKSFSSYCQKVKILEKENIALTLARIELLKAVNQVLKNSLYLLNIPYITKM